jgi:phosphoglycerate dehydrogenase-like enzyme
MHLVELARIGDLDTRRALATLAAQQGWTARQLRLAAQQVKDGRWPDSLPHEPGIFPEADEDENEEAPTLQPGRIATRFAKVAQSLDDVVAQWERLDVGQVKPAYRARVAASLDRLVARAAEIKRRLGAGDGG